MGVYIDMEMPVTCCHCPLMSYDPDREWFDSMARMGVHICVLTGELIDNTKREEHCPLFPVPTPHGRLIDADALIKELEIDDLDDRTGAALLMAVFLEVLKSAPTIIPAEPCNNLSKPCKEDEP